MFCSIRSQLTTTCEIGKLLRTSRGGTAFRRLCRRQGALEYCVRALPSVPGSWHRAAGLGRARGRGPTFSEGQRTGDVAAVLE